MTYKAQSNIAAERLMRGVKVGNYFPPGGIPMGQIAQTVQS